MRKGEIMIIKFNNQNPTEAEKKLFFYAGYYCIEESPISLNDHETGLKQLKYAVVHVEDNKFRDTRLNIDQKIFPEHIELDEKNINYDDTIIFDMLSETIKFSSYADIELLSFIFQRMKELGFKHCFELDKFKINRLLFSNRLRELRISHGLSTSQLASILGFKSKGSIGNFESGKAIPLADSLYSIANFFKVSLDYLTGRSDIPHLLNTADSLNEENFRLQNNYRGFL